MQMESPLVYLPLDFYDHPEEVERWVLGQKNRKKHVSLVFRLTTESYYWSLILTCERTSFRIRSSGFRISQVFVTSPKILLSLSFLFMMSLPPPPCISNPVTFYSLDHAGLKPYQQSSKPSPASECHAHVDLHSQHQQQQDL